MRELIREIIPLKRELGQSSQTGVVDDKLESYKEGYNQALEDVIQLIVDADQEDVNN